MLLVDFYLAPQDILNPHGIMQVLFDKNTKVDTHDKQSKDGGTSIKYKEKTDHQNLKVNTREEMQKVKLPGSNSAARTTEAPATPNAEGSYAISAKL